MIFTGVQHRLFFFFLSWGVLLWIFYPWESSEVEFCNHKQRKKRKKTRLENSRARVDTSLCAGASLRRVNRCFSGFWNFHVVLFTSHPLQGDALWVASLYTNVKIVKSIILWPREEVRFSIAPFHNCVNNLGKSFPNAYASRISIIDFVSIKTPILVSFEEVRSPVSFPGKSSVHIS